MNRLLLKPPPTLSDERLARLSADGLDSAFAMLVLRHRRALVHHCAELVGYADAEEVVQEALLRAYLALGRGESVNHVGAWLRTIAHNAAVNLLRARAARPSVSARELEPERTDGDTFERRESLREVVRALEELPERQRQALVMRELEGLSYAEIEARLNTSNGAVRQLLNRARAAIRDRLDAVAGLVPAIRWILGDGGGTTTAARLGALSGGCAATIKLCTATVLPAVLGPVATAPKPPTSDRHQASPSSRSVQGMAASAVARPSSTRATLDPQPLLASTRSRRRSTPNAAPAVTTGTTNESQPRVRAWSHRSSLPTGRRGASPAAGATGSAGSPATTPGWSTGGSHTPLQMGPNESSSSTTQGPNPDSAPGGSFWSAPGNSGGQSTDESPGSPMPGSEGMTPHTGSAVGPGEPQPSPGSS